jgi:hypothetical protein
MILWGRVADVFRGARGFGFSGRKLKTPALPNQRAGHPEKQNQSLGVNLLEWYDPNRGQSSTGKRERFGYSEFVTLSLIPNSSCNIPTYQYGGFMCALLWLIASLLLLGAAAIALFLLKGKPSSLAVPKLGISDFVNISVLLVAVVSLYVAVATYMDAKASAEQQQKTLDASRMALETVVHTAQGQQNLLEQNLETSKTQLSVVQAQWRQEQDRQSRRAQLSMVSLNGTPWETIDQNHDNIQVVIPPAGWIRMAFVLRNTGTASLVHPIYIVFATLENVFVGGADFRVGRNNHNQFQQSGVNVLDVLPHSVSGTDFNISVDVTVPNPIQNFDLTFRALGENMDGAKVFTLHFVVTHQQQ